MSVEHSIEDNLYLVRICHMSGQHELVIKYIEELIKQRKGNLTEEERNLLFSALKSLINFRRESWRTVNALETKEKKNESRLLSRVSQLKSELFNEIFNYVNKGIQIIDNHLWKNANNDELRVNYAKIKADYNRYLLDLTPKENESSVNELKNKVDENYKIGLSFCNNLSSLNSTKIGLILNYTVFLFDNIGDQERAYKIANDTYMSSTQAINEDNYDMKLLKSLKVILGLLKDNIIKWSEKLGKPTPNLIEIPDSPKNNGTNPNSIKKEKEKVDK